MAWSIAAPCFAGLLLLGALVFFLRGMFRS